MPKKETVNRIDGEWQARQPGWGLKEHGGEREMLYDVLDHDESIESLVGCVWGPGNVFRANASRWDRMRQYDGIAVLTGRRVILLKKKGMNKLITEMPLHNMESVDVDATGEVTLTGRSYSEWAGSGDEAAFKMRDVQYSYARNFADRVREVKAAPPPPTTPTSSSASAGGSAVPTANYTAMSKAERINAQWRERSTMWSRNDPGVPERLITVLLSSFTGENVTTYPGELRILHEILEDDENIEYWMGGRWGDASEFNTLGDAIDTMLGGFKHHEFGVHNGVVVATDRRVLMLNSGMVMKDVVEVPYEGLQVDYNEGMTCSGLKFSGSANEDYAYYLDHNGKRNIRSRARPLFDCVQRRAAAASGKA